MRREEVLLSMVQLGWGKKEAGNYNGDSDLDVLSINHSLSNWMLELV